MFLFEACAHTVYSMWGHLKFDKNVELFLEFLQIVIDSFNGVCSPATMSICYMETLHWNVLDWYAL